MNNARSWLMRCSGLAAALAACAAAQAADLGARRDAELDPFSPTRPVGIASELPRSPLADATVFGSERFPTSADAQARCPRDIVVRVETLSNVLRPVRVPGPGVFMCKSSALSEGDLPR